MNGQEKLPERKPTRLRGHDYSAHGAYFITICTQNRKNILSKIVGDGAYDVPQVALTRIGAMVERYILSSHKMKGITVEKYVIMPNHIHMIIHVADGGTSRAPSPTNAVVPHFVSTLKRFCHAECGQKYFNALITITSYVMARATIKFMITFKTILRDGRMIAFIPQNSKKVLAQIHIWGSTF